jgi:L-glyceraldehyde 3-phosphate reductase
MHKAKDNRYENMPYRRCGRSGLMLPAISLGLWHNFGHVDLYDSFKQVVFRAFDRGITHFDLANNYGPPPGSAEENFGKILKENLSHYRDEMIISTKAGYQMWPGPYGEWGSRKYLVASLDQSLKRLGLDYVDIFYSHRPDPNTPMEETMMALDHLVRQGKALYVGISSYTPDQTQEAAKILRDLGTPCLIHQPKYSMFERWVEDELLDRIEKDGIGSIAFSPLAQGLLTNKYINGIPENSRAAKSHGYLQKDQITDKIINKVIALNKIAEKREQSLAQMAIAWLLKDDRITSVLVGASSAAQLDENINSINNLNFEMFELEEIEKILNE